MAYTGGSGLVQQQYTRLGYKLNANADAPQLATREVSRGEVRVAHEMANLEQTEQIKRASDQC
eukprot:1613240-Prymnesium_polylepis.1